MRSWIPFSFQWGLFASSELTDIHIPSLNSSLLWLWICSKPQSTPTHKMLNKPFLLKEPMLFVERGLFDSDASEQCNYFLCLSVNYQIVNMYIPYVSPEIQIKKCGHLPIHNTAQFLLSVQFPTRINPSGPWNNIVVVYK